MSPRFKVHNTTATANARQRRGVIASLGRPKVAVMLMLGFSSGLPFLLTGNTLGYWMRDEGTALGAIGFLSWVGLAYSLKFIWAPVVDRLDAPVFGRLGRRRGWMLFNQCLIAAGLGAIATVGLRAGLASLSALALIVAFSSATQDIAVDAWRIEAADDPDELGLLSAAHQLGYRAALLTTDALILFAANHWGWPASYAAMAALMAVGAGASAAAIEPMRARGILADNDRALPLSTPRGLFDACVGPFAAFVRTHGRLALLMLATISLYRLPEFMMGPMVNPFYHDLGLSKDVVGAIRTSIGLPSALLGITAGGMSALRFGHMKTLIGGVILQSLVIAAYALLASSGPDLRVFGAVMAAETFGASFAGVALVTYMSTLTSLGYTATQYALLSSAYAYAGKLAKGFSGMAVERLAAGRTLLEGYGLFFIGAGLLGLPALILCVVLARLSRQPPRAREEP